MADDPLGPVPAHLAGDAYVAALREEINALIGENESLHHRLDAQGKQIDKLLVQRKGAGGSNMTISPPTSGELEKNIVSPGNAPTISIPTPTGRAPPTAASTPLVASAVPIPSLLSPSDVLGAPPPPPPQPPAATGRARENRAQTQNTTSWEQEHTPLQAGEMDPLVLEELQRLKLLRTTGKSLPTKTIAQKKFKKMSKRETKSEENSPVSLDSSESSLYEAIMHTSPMKEVDPSPRNVSSNMSHVAHTKGAKANHAHEIMAAGTLADRAEKMREKTLKSMTFGRRTSEAVSRHGYQLMHHNLGARAFMGESYSGNLSPFTHAKKHQGKTLGEVQADLKAKKTRRTEHSNPTTQRVRSKVRNAAAVRQKSAAFKTAFGRRVSLAGGRSAHILTHHLLSADAFVGESYNAYHSTATGRMGRNPMKSTELRSPVEDSSKKNFALSLEEVAEGAYEYESDD